MSYTEIFKLKKMLEEADIPFEFTDRNHGFDEFFFESYQFEYPCSYKNKDNERICSIVEGYGTYGNDKDLLEIMGLLTPEEIESDSVCGWLTAENVFERIKKHYEQRSDNNVLL